MKTTRTYVKGCDWCQATGFVLSRNIDTTSSLTEICPVCQGAKIIPVVETIEDTEVNLKELLSDIL